ncbi:MAG: hypothetical protein AAF696_30180, partial [Bacteroidota bacterium]
YSCVNEDFLIYGDKSRKSKLNLSIRPGLSLNTIEFGSGNPNYAQGDFSFRPGIRMGFEAEFVVPWWTKKLMVVVEPAFRYHNTNNLSINGKKGYDFMSIAASTGLRYNIFLNRSRIFINLNLIIDFPLNESVFFENGLGYFTRTGLSLTPSIGFKLASKISIEARYSRFLQVLENFSEPPIRTYNTIEFILGYQIY